jgi:hypothetical protein
VLVVVAYYPQIHHLSVERCAWGISRLTWLIWLASSALLLAYCILRREFMKHGVAVNTQSDNGVELRGRRTA